MKVTVTTNDTGILTNEIENVPFDPNRVLSHEMDWDQFREYIMYFTLNSGEPGFILTATCSR